jgi:hypothetical protein
LANVIYKKKAKLLFYNILQVGGRFPAYFLASSKLGEGFQHTFYLPPSWREVSSILFSVLQVGGRLPANFLSSSKLEEGFQLTF